MENIVRNLKPGLEGEQYLTDKEVSKLLKISRRCLQDYRTDGKILYRAGGIEQFLREHYENRTNRDFTCT